MVGNFEASSYNTGVMNSAFSAKYFEKLLRSHNSNIEIMVDHLIFCLFMSKARKTWIAQTGTGSQCEEFKIHRMMAEAVIAHVNTKKKEHAEEADITLPEEVANMEKLF